MNLRKLGFGSLGLAGLGIAAVALAAADPALAKPRYKANKAHMACASGPADLSFRHFWFAGEPVPNGCSPPVYQHGRFIGQDPDPNIRFQLMRQPETGYTITK